MAWWALPEESIASKTYVLENTLLQTAPGGRGEDNKQARGATKERQTIDMSEGRPLLKNGTWEVIVQFDFVWIKD